MSVPDYDGCQDWQSVAALHRSTLRLPEALVSSDPTLGQWKARADSSLAPPSDDAPGPTLESLLSQPTIAAFLDQSCQGLANPDFLKDKDATALVSLMKEGVVSVEQVVRHFLARTAIIHQATGCLSHFFHDRALQRARDLDEKRATFEAQDRIDELGGCFGLPISVKGHLHYAGEGSQRGFVFDVLPSPSNHPLVRSNLKQDQIDYLRDTSGGYVNDPRVDSHLVSLLLDADAVILAKTTMPQGVMHLDTRSNLYGQTLNPWNLALSPGGSSGGESALVAGGGTLLGVGSDIGGSIRQPAGVCNLYGLRPTTLRVPYAGVRSTMPGNEGVVSSLGPIARSLRDVELFMSSVVNDRTQPWKREHSVLPMPWRKVDSLIASGAAVRKLVIGVMLDDGVVRPTAPIRRALTAWLGKLETSPQIELKLYQPGELHRRSWDLIRSLYFMDSGKTFHLLAKATGEPLLPLTRFILQEKNVCRANKNLAGDSDRRLDGMSVTELWSKVREREAFRKEFLQNWNDLGLDCLLCPVMGNVAPRPGQIRYWGYTSTFNLVDFPGMAFPSDFFADAAKDRAYEEAESAGGDRGAWKYAPQNDDHSEFDLENRKEYQEHRSVFDGAPVGLQLIARRYQDEELCKYVELLENIFHRS
ncbi:hypothetical protein ACQY0O_007381 [Thecaphora frezii]